MAHVIAIDAGTTSVRCIAFDEHGVPVARTGSEFTQHFPRDGWVEHDAAEIWDVTRAALTELVAGLDQPVAAIGITNQRETVVAWDRRTGRPRARAIVWQDRRTAERCTELTEQGALPLVRERTGLVLDPYFSGSKVEWLLRHGGVEADEHLAIGTIDSWLVWNLTGGAAHVTDPSNASRTMLLDIGTLAWDAELCDLFGVPASCLPTVGPSSGRLGTTAASAGVPGGIPVSGVAGDQQAALFGQVCFSPGEVKNTYGTGSFVLLNVGATCPPPAEGILTTVAWDLGDAPVYALEAAIFVTGAAIQWLRDGLGLIKDASETGPLAASVPDSGGVLLVPAFTGLACPWWDPYARGALVGITRGTTRAHLARAVVEAMAYQTRDAVTAMCAAAGAPVTALRVDGGASAMDLLLQLQADQLQVPVSRPRNLETTALGAAYLAGLAEGVWGGLDELRSQWQLDVEVPPSVEPAVADALHAQWLRAVDRSRGWIAPA